MSAHTTVPLDQPAITGAFREFALEYAFRQRFGRHPKAHFDGDELAITRGGRAAQIHHSAGRGVPFKPVHHRSRVPIAELLLDDHRHAGPHGDLHTYLSTIEEPPC